MYANWAGGPQLPLEALDLGRLRVCRASDNCIRELPTDLDRLTALTILDLAHNLIQASSRFPPPAGAWRGSE